MKKPEIFFILCWILSLLWRFYQGPFADLAVLFSGLCLFVAYVIFSKGLFGLSINDPNARVLEVTSGVLFSTVILCAIFSTALWHDLFPFSVLIGALLLVVWFPIQINRYKKSSSTANLFLAVRGAGLIIVSLIIFFTFQIHYFYSNQTKPVIEKSEGLTQEKVERINFVVDSFRLANGIVGLSVGIEAENALYLGGFGNIKKGDEVPSSKSVYEIASVTKPIIGLLYSLLEQEGRVSLDQKVSIKGVEMSDRIKTITYRELLSHTSGLPRMIPSYFYSLMKAPRNPYKFIADNEVEEYLESAEFAGNPLRKSVYSNFGYALLAKSLTQAGGAKYEEGRGLERLLQENVFQPLGMDHSYIFSNENSQTGRYNKSGKEMPKWTTNNHYGAFGVQSTVKDLLAYTQSHVNMEDDLFHQAVRKTLTPLIDFTNGKSVGYGWQIEKESNQTSYWHNGATFYSSSFVYFNPNTQFSLVVLSNTGVSVDGLAGILLKEIKFLDLKLKN